MAAAGVERRNWELATESIVVRIRWFGIAMGYILVQTRVDQLRDPSAVRAFLALGAGFAALDTVFHRMGEVVLERRPLFVSLMEGLFIALLCYHDIGLESPFRWYYLLSLICCAIRYRPVIAWLTFGIHCASLMTLAWASNASPAEWRDLPLTLAIFAWSTWAAVALTRILKQTGRHLEQANAELERNRAELEQRVEERTKALRASQARVIHQEKMATFGLLAAGIAHEVGNPLAALSSLVQLLQRRHRDDYTAEKLDLAGRQLGRIQRTLQDLTAFSRPAPPIRVKVRLADVVEDVLAIAKYHTRTRDRSITIEVPANLPSVLAVRDHLSQIILNLILNAVDATQPSGRITITALQEDARIKFCIEDDGRGVEPAERARLFQPYFTTKTQGTGLGLFVSRQLVEEMGGSLEYEPGEETGSRFLVRFPGCQVPEERSVPVLVGERG